MARWRNTDEQKEQYYNTFYDCWEFSGYDDQDADLPFGAPWDWCSDDDWKPQPGETVEEAAERWYRENRQGILTVFKEEVVEDYDLAVIGSEKRKELKEWLDELEQLLGGQSA